MAELGQTEDPKALIPGDAGAITENVMAIHGRGKSLESTGNALKAVDTGNYWKGDGANQFRETFSQVPPKWITAGDAFAQVGRALEGFALSLSWAQGQAAEAIRIWKEAEEATRRAIDAHNSAVAQAAVLSAASSTPVEVAPFVDPGVEGRQVAQAILRSARAQLASAGDSAAQALRAAADTAPEKPAFWDRAKYWASEFGGGIWDSVKEINDLTQKFGYGRLMADPSGYLDDTLTVAAGLGGAVTNPVEFGKQMIDYDTWRESPMRALGHLAPDGAAALVTGGGAAVGKRVGVEALETSLKHEGVEAVEDSLKHTTDVVDDAARGHTLRDLPKTDALPIGTQPDPSRIAPEARELIPDDYTPYGELSPEQFAARYHIAGDALRPDGTWDYPPDGGFQHGPDGRPIIEDYNYQPPTGTRFDRFGSEWGNFLAPENTPFGQRALPPDSMQKPYHTYEVTGNPLPDGWSIQRGPTAPWFEQEGLGEQIKIVPPAKLDQPVLEVLRELGYFK